MTARVVREVRLNNDQTIKVECRMKRTHKLKSPIIKRRMDPREPQQIEQSRRFIDRWMMHLEAIIPSMKSDGLIDMTDPARLGVVAERLIKDMSTNISSEEINHQSRLCGYPENKMLECVLAVLIGKAAIELSTHTSEAHKASMEKALEDAYIFPPPRTTLVVNLADRLSMCLAIKSSMSTSFLHSVQTSLTTQKEDIMNTKPENQEAQINSGETGTPEDTGTTNTTSTQSETASGSGVESDQASGSATSNNQPKAEASAAKQDRKETTDSINVTTTGVVLSFIVMVFVAGALMGMLTYFLEVGLLPWLAGLGLGTLATAIVLGIIGIIAGTAIAYVTLSVGGWIMSLFEKDGADKAQAPQATATPKTA